MSRRATDAHLARPADHESRAVERRVLALEDVSVGSQDLIGATGQVRRYSGTAGSPSRSRSTLGADGSLTA